MDELRRAHMLRIGNAFVADSATVTARVRLGEDSNIWYGVVVRGDDAPITIGARTNIQDNTVVHVDPGAPNVLGHDITVGHGVICHGVEVADFALIGMGAILLGGCRVGEGAIIGAGAVLLENTEIPPFSVAVGTPARVIKTVDPEARRRDAIAQAAGYVKKANEHAEGRWDGMVSA